ncbi:hypothetical protein RvY_16706 [Ramazzottius varieornatus]|uniref:Endonuclease/exonuclease/phosphatase domain-containing protein n=1 Tax=Ramazzottius varieornatus TaxID=947166 RepID=A0A1D1VZH7_RAMVA|nr:hypothetical protein RvY_16706 [Ramazzottius varieornatus]
MTNVQGTFDGELRKHLTLRYANLNGVKCKTEELTAWTKKGEKFNVCRKDRTGCRKESGGGVAVIAKKDLRTSRAVEYEVDGLELMWLKIVGLRKVALVGVLYAPGYYEEVFAKLSRSLESISPYLRRNLILVGDFSCPDID